MLLGLTKTRCLCLALYTRLNITTPPPSLCPIPGLPPPSVHGMDIPSISPPPPFFSFFFLPPTIPPRLLLERRYHFIPLAGAGAPCMASGGCCLQRAPSGGGRAIASGAGLLLLRLRLTLHCLAGLHLEANTLRKLSHTLRKGHCRLQPDGDTVQGAPATANRMRQQSGRKGMLPMLRPCACMRAKYKEDKAKCGGLKCLSL